MTAEHCEALYAMLFTSSPYSPLQCLQAFVHVSQIADHALYLAVVPQGDLTRPAHCSCLPLKEGL